MTALVSYYGSSDSENENDEEDMDTSTSTHTPTKLPHDKTANALMLKPHISDDSDDDEPEDELNSLPGSSISEKFDTKSKLDSLLPLPKPIPKISDSPHLQLGGIEEIGAIPPKKVYGDEEKPDKINTGLSIHNLLSRKTSSGTVQISIPSLKDFKDDDDDNMSSRKRNLLESKKGSGLFALLPQPKSETVSINLTKSSQAKSIIETDKSAPPPVSISSPVQKQASIPMIPFSVQQSASGVKRVAGEANDKLAQIKAKYLKSETNFKFVSRSKEPTKKKIEKDSSGESDDEMISSSDFFSLDNKKEDHFDKKNMSLEDFKFDTHPPKRIIEEPTDKSNDSYEMETEISTLPTPIFENEKSSSSSASHEDLIQIMDSSKKRRGNKIDEMNIIDINADDLKPKTNEWLKTITDKSIIPPRKANLPGGTSKRKHQITYLAAEAKAREEELQNQWASNRHSRRATQNKYGF